MNFIIWLVVGGLIGWVASMIMRTDGQQGIFLNIIVGIVGAMLGGWLISPLVGVPTINQGSLSVGALVVSLLGAAACLYVILGLPATAKWRFLIWLAVGIALYFAYGFRHSHLHASD